MRNFFFVTLFFFLFTFSLFAQSKPTLSQTEVYIWGSIFFCLSMGSLLLIVYLFPKNELYKKQKQAKKEKAQKISAPPTPKKPEIETVEQKTVTTNVTVAPKTEEKKEEPTPVAQHSIHTELPKSAPSMPNITKPEVEAPKTPPPQPTAASTELVITSFDFLFKIKNLAVENVCREFLSKIYLIVPSKSISIYFVKSQQFTRFIERKGESINLYDPIAERSDFSEEVIQFLKKKLGAFSSTHSDVVLPLIAENQLYGGVKIVFQEPQKNFNIGPVWSEIKQFAKQFHATFLNAQTQEKDTLFNLEHFQNILSYRVTLDISQNLTLIKVLNNSEKSKILNLTGEALKDILGKKPEVYKIAEDTIGIFLTIEAREKLGKSLGELLTKVRKQSGVHVDLCVGSIDYHSKFQPAQKWLEKAKDALTEAVKAGPNNYKLLVEKN